MCWQHMPGYEVDLPSSNSVGLLLRQRGQLDAAIAHLTLTTLVFRGFKVHERSWIVLDLGLQRSSVDGSVFHPDVTIMISGSVCPVGRSCHTGVSVNWFRWDRRSLTTREKYNKETRINSSRKAS